MSSSSSSSSSMPPFTKETVLDDDCDFESLLSPDGHISICGFGSHLSERSARCTFPNLLNFRVAKLHHFRRVFAHDNSDFYDLDIAKPETTEVSGLYVEPCEGETTVVTVFEITKSELLDFVKEKSGEFRFLAVLPQTLDGKSFDFPAVLCARCTYMDGVIRARLSTVSSKITNFWLTHYGKIDIDGVWRADFLPCRVYLRHCVLAARNLGDTAYNNFLDHTYLVDLKTTVREYLATTGSGILEEEPPESVKDRYDGR